MSDQRAPSRRYLLFALAAVGMLMASIDSTIVAVAIPTLTSALDTSLTWVGWTLTSYQLVQIIMMPLAGRLSDELGRKRVFMFCIGSFTIGSLLCGLAPNVGFLILFRVIQAVGGGGLLPSATGIVSDQFKERRNQAIGLFSSILPIGGILGPNLGGWIIEHWTWREIFFVNLPIGLIILVGAQLLLRDRPAASRSQGIDVAGLGLFAGGMVAIMYAMTLAGTDPGIWQSPLLWLLLAAAACLFVMFFRQERRAAQPIVEIELLARRPFLQANIYNFIFGACSFGFISFVPYFAVVQYGMDTAASGAALTPRSITVMLASMMTSLFILRLGYRVPMIVGMIVIAISFFLLSLGLSSVLIGPLELDGFWLTWAAMAISGAGVGLTSPAANNATIDLLPERTAAITGLRGMFRISGGIIGISSIVLALSFFNDQAAGMRTIFLALAFFLLAGVPLALTIPDTARERWRQQQLRGIQQ